MSTGILDATTNSVVYDEKDGNRKQIVPDRATLPTRVAVSGTTARNATALEPGIYELCCTTACAFAQGGATIEAVAATGHPLAAYERVLIAVDSTRTHVAVIQAAAAGSLAITRATAVF